MRALLAGVLASIVLVTPAEAASDLVISQAYASGGTSGAVYTHDYVELHNRGLAPVAVGGMTLRVYRTDSDFYEHALFSPTTLPAGSIAPGAYYLIRLASGGAVGAATPAPDHTGSINLLPSSGFIELHRSGGGLVDSLGYGGEPYVFAEGNAPAPGMTTTTGLVRKAEGCQDTDHNANDFAVETVGGSRTPRNSASLYECPIPPSVSCGSGQLQTTQGTAASLAVSASDANDVITSIAIAGVAPEGFFVTNFAGAQPGGTATATLQVTEGAAPGSHPLTLRASSDSGETAECAVMVTVAAKATPPPTVEELDVAVTGKRATRKAVRITLANAGAAAECRLELVVAKRTVRRRTVLLAAGETQEIVLKLDGATRRKLRKRGLKAVVRGELRAPDGSTETLRARLPLRRAA